MGTEQKIVVNELLCFLSNKVRSMTYDAIIKLCLDFYDEESVTAAKYTLLENVAVSNNDDKKRKRIGPNKKINGMKDILNIFLELTVEDVPLFVANNLKNLPPLSMDNFDMSRIIHGMEALKMQLKIIQEVQETSLATHAALCQEATPGIPGSPTYSTGTPPSPMTSHTHTPAPQQEVPLMMTQQKPKLRQPMSICELMTVSLTMKTSFDKQEYRVDFPPPPPHHNRQTTTLRWPRSTVTHEPQRENNAQHRPLVNNYHALNPQGHNIGVLRGGKGPCPPPPLKLVKV